MSASYAVIDGLVSGSRGLNGDTFTVSTRPDGNGVSNTTTIRPDGTRSVQTRTHGLVTATAQLATDSSVITRTSYNYDSQQRPLTVTDLRTGASSYDLNDDGMADVTGSGQAHAMKTAAGHATAFSYDKLGRTIAVDAPDTLDAAGATLANQTFTAYYPNSGNHSQLAGSSLKFWRSRYCEIFKVTGADCDELTQPGLAPPHIPATKSLK